MLRIPHIPVDLRVNQAAVLRPQMPFSQEVRTPQGPGVTHWSGQGRDRLELSADGLAMNRLLRLWGAVSALFGRTAEPQSAPLLDLRELQQALQQARENARRAQQRAGVLDTLKASALREAEALVARYYGLQGDGVPLRIVLHDDMGDALASVSYRYDARGRMADQHLNVSVRQFLPDSGPNGTNDHVIENDRIIAHEVTHAVMGRNMDVSRLPDWFIEGTAEYIAGGAERVRLALRVFTPQGLMHRLTHPWEGDSSQYAAGYIAVRYLDEVTAPNGGLKAVMARLKEGDSLDEAVAGVTGGALSVESLLHDLVQGGAGATLAERIAAERGDAGSIKPGRGPDVVPDRRMPSNQPMKGFEVRWPSPVEGLRGLHPIPWFGPPAPVWVTAMYQRYNGVHYVVRST